jgi:hypothetical protein
MRARYNCYDGKIRLRNNSKYSKTRLALAAISFLLLCVFILEAVSMASVARGESAYSFYATPSTGVKTSSATIIGSGLPPNTELQLIFGIMNVGSCTTSPEGTVNVQFGVPLVSPGSYLISAVDSNGTVDAVTSFTVIVNQQTVPTFPPLPTASVSSTETPQQSQYPPPSTNPSSYVNPILTLPPYSHSPGTPKSVEGGVSPLMIGIIVAVIIAVIFPLTFFIRRRGGPESIYEEASETPTAPAPTYPPRTQTTPTVPRSGPTLTYGQYRSRSTMPSGPGMPSRYGQSSAVSTRVCPRCRQTIRADYSICPHCNKRLK